MFNLENKCGMEVQTCILLEAAKIFKN